MCVIRGAPKRQAGNSSPVKTLELPLDDMLSLKAVYFSFPSTYMDFPSVDIVY